MISLFSNEPGSPDGNQPQAATQSQAAYPAAQHPAVSKTVVTPPAPSSTALAPRYANTHAAAPTPAQAPEKHGIFSWLSIGKAKKRLQMLETVSLGEKRFVALVQVDGRQFLIGGAPSNVGMLAELAPEETFHQVLRDATEDLNESPEAQPAQAPAPATLPAPVAVSVPAAPVMAAPLPMPQPITTPAPVHYASVAPLPLAEAAPSAVVIAAPAPKPATPSLPPHVAARLAELQAAAVIAAAPAKTAHSVLADDLSLEEPVSFSPSLLAAMQQRARAAVFQAETAGGIAEPAPVQNRVPQDILPVAQEAVAAPASAPSFTFQFSPMLTSTTQAIRLPGSAMKLQGAAS